MSCSRPVISLRVPYLLIVKGFASAVKRARGWGLGAGGSGWGSGASCDFCVGRWHWAKCFYLFLLWAALGLFLAWKIEMRHGFGVVCGARFISWVSIPGVGAGGGRRGVYMIG